MTVEEIRKRYPSPIRPHSEQSKVDRYCVLGAACRAFLGSTLWDFPKEEFAAERLGISLVASCRIAAHNDAGDFEGAWSLLDDALKARRNDQ